MRAAIVTACALAMLGQVSSAQTDSTRTLPTRKTIFQRSLAGAAIGAAIGGIAGPSNINTICERPGSGCDASRWIANGGGFGFMLGGAIGAAAGAHSTEVGVPGMLANFGLALVSGIPGVELAIHSATPVIALTPFAQAAVVAWRTDRALSDQRRKRGGRLPTMPALHDGFWLTVGAGAGSANVGCTSCDGFASSDPWRGGAAGTGFLAMGGTLSSGRLVGGEFNNWTKHGASEAQQTLVLAVMQTYTGSSPFYTKLGAGLGSIDMMRGDPVQQIDAVGPAALFGVGYDWRASRSFALSPYVSYAVMLPAARRHSNTTNDVSSGMSANVQAGVALAWY